MLDSALAAAVAFCTRHRWSVIIVAILAALGSAAYTAQHFAVNTDIDRLLSPDLPWRQREAAYKQAFPQDAEAILAVVGGPTPEAARESADRLVARMDRQGGVYRSVQNLATSDFFVRNSLLYQSPDELAATTGKLAQAAPLVQMLSTDPSLRGLSQVLLATLQGAQSGKTSLDDMARPMTMAADTIEGVLDGRPASFSWRVLVSGKPAAAQDLHQLVTVWPVLDYDALEPGRAATAALRRAAADVDADVRLTGPVPIADEEFASLREGAALNGMLSAVAVLVILWLALRSIKLVAAVAVTVAAGLAITAGIGLALVGALNPISVAFAVLSVGLGADFAIQFSVRYRTERHGGAGTAKALAMAAQTVGAPLTLAAAAAAAGFFSFLPTDYRGLAELGLIAGCGMVVAYVASMTLLPALLCVLRPPPEPKPLGYERLAPADRFLQRHRIGVVAITSLIALAGLPALTQLRFDFNPISLRNSHSEAVATLNALAADSRIDVNAAQVLVARSDLGPISRKLSALPEVARLRSLDSFVPADQDKKFPLINSAAGPLRPALTASPRPRPSDAENIGALERAAARLKDAAEEQAGPGPEAAIRLAGDLDKLADAPPGARDAAQAAFVDPLKSDLADLKRSLDPARVTRDNLPPELVRDWSTSDGRLRLEIAPKGDANDGEVLSRFARAVLSVAPAATGQAVSTYEWGSAVLTAFAQAAAWALCSIAVLLWIVLRRVRDVLITLIPLLVAAAVTLEICALADFPLNYANIIALPVLLGIGVAFKIYYVMAWRRGETNFLQSSLTRAVFFSALMTAVAFGSLWFSSHPGTSSMGKLLALSLACTLASAALFQPALMGPPRDRNAET